MSSFIHLSSAGMQFHTAATPPVAELYAALRRRKQAYAAYGRLSLDITRPYLQNDPERLAAIQETKDTEAAVVAALAAIEDLL